jgi:hypothetical protein
MWFVGLYSHPINFYPITSFFAFVKINIMIPVIRYVTLIYVQCNMQGSHRWFLLSQDRSLFNMLRTFIKNTEQCFIHY